MQNTVFLHAHAINLGNGEVSILLNVSMTGYSEKSAICCFQAASRKYHQEAIGEAYAPPAHEIRLLASRPASETQRIINAIKKFGKRQRDGVFCDVLRKNSYNHADGLEKKLYCPDAFRAIKSLVKQVRGW